jgi:hypothetical protein
MRAKLIIITGLMATGTSAVAGAVNRLGFPVALWTPPPSPPKYRLEYEDLDLLGALQAVAPWGRDPSDADRAQFAWWLSDTLPIRLQSLERVMRPYTGWFRGVAIKSPQLAMFLPELLSAAAALGLDARVVLCRRDAADLERAFVARYTPGYPTKLPLVRETQRLIGAALEGVEGYGVDYAELVASPASVVGRLAEHLGVKDPAAVAAAAATIER